MALDAILDTRFYFSYYSPENEKVATWTRDVVRRAVKGDIRLASSVVTIVELYRTMGRFIGLDAVRVRVASIKSSGIRFIPLTEEVAVIAGEIVVRHPCTPIADAIIAATAIVHANGVVATDDPHFENIKGVKVKWLRKL